MVFQFHTIADAMYRSTSWNYIKRTVRYNIYTEVEKIINARV